MPVRNIVLYLLALETLAHAAGAIAADAAATDDSQPNSDALQEVIVTSERSAENLQRTPVAITAISGDTLEQRGLSDMKELSLLVPSSRFSVETNVVQIFIRGVGTQIDSPFVPEPVAVNFNDVYLPRFATGTSLFDVSRIEVLPGPQGTLYGKSALGGVVNISANEPTHDWLADGVVEGGNYGMTHFTGVLNAPVTDDLAVRLAVNKLDHDGYYSTGTDTEHSEALRLSALYTPGEMFSLLLWGSYYLNHDRPQASTYIPYPDPGNPWRQPRYDPLSAAFYPPNGYDLTNTYGRYQSATVAARAQWELPGLTITYLPAFLTYQHNDNHTLQGFPVPDTSNIHQDTQELRLVGKPSGPFSYLGGFYWYRNEADWTAVLGPFLGGYAVPNTSTGYAAYAQGTYAIQNWLRATGGLRYSSDREYAPNGANIFPLGAPPDFTEGLLPFSAHAHWSHVDWKVGLEADLAAHSMVYGNVQTGYDPGGYSSTAPTSGTPLSEQTMLGFTLGAKNRFLDDHFQLNDELFYYNYKNYLLTAQEGASSLSFNVPKSRIFGDELDAIYAFNQGTQVNVSVGLLSAKIRQFSVNGNSYAGYQLPYAPQATVSAGAQQNWSLPGGASLTGRVDTHFENGYWGVFSHTSGLHQDPFTKTDVSLTYYAANGRWDVGLWGRNLEDTGTFAAAAESGYPAPFQADGYLEQPRTFGVRFHANWAGGK
jgi:iron complex outermembrane receptor protein